MSKVGRPLCGVGNELSTFANCSHSYGCLFQNIHTSAAFLKYRMGADGTWLIHGPRNPCSALTVASQLVSQHSRIVDFICN